MAQHLCPPNATGCRQEEEHQAPPSERERREPGPYQITKLNCRASARHPLRCLQNVRMIKLDGQFPP